MTNKKGLGRGLDALFSTYDNEKNFDETKHTENAVDEIAIALIKPNINQPRKNFDEESLKELAQSIKVHGIIQPIILNKQEDGTYMVIAGERRFKAAKMAGLDFVPAVIKNYTTRQIKEISIIENLQREDLNPIEAARAIKQLMQEYSITQDEVAERIGKSRPAVANLIRILTLPNEVVGLVEANKLSAGHARSLVTILNDGDKIKIANYAVSSKLSVRELEKYVKEFLSPKQKRTTPVANQSLELKDLISRLQKVFGTKVSVIGNDNKGRIYLDYYSTEDLDRINQILNITESRTLTLKDLNNFNQKKF